MSALDQQAGGLKYDTGKSPVTRGALHYFPRAIAAVADVSAFGARKYAWRNWQGLDDGVQRYLDAAGRHLLAIANDALASDAESELPHLAHAAWSVLAALELLLRAQAEAAKRQS